MARITVEDCLSHIPNRFTLTLAATYRARELAQLADARLTVAEIARDLGRLYAQTGRPAQARSALREAVEAFGDLGALGEVRATRLELETLGAG